MSVDAGDLIIDWRYTRGASQHPSNVVTWTFADPGWQVLGQWHGQRSPTEGRSAQLTIRYFDAPATLNTSATTVQSGPSTTLPLLSIRVLQNGLADVVNWRSYIGEVTSDVEQVHLTGAPWAGDYAWATAAGLNVKAFGTGLDGSADHELDDTGVWSGGVDNSLGVPTSFRATAPSGATPIAADPSPLLGPYGRVTNFDPPPEHLVTAGPWFLWLLAVNGRPGRRRGFGMIKSPR